MSPDRNSRDGAPAESVDAGVTTIGVSPDTLREQQLERSAVLAHTSLTFLRDRFGITIPPQQILVKMGDKLFVRVDARVALEEGEQAQVRFIFGYNTESELRQVTRTGMQPGVSLNDFVYLQAVSAVYGRTGGRPTQRTIEVKKFLTVVDSDTLNKLLAELLNEHFKVSAPKLVQPVGVAGIPEEGPGAMTHGSGADGDAERVQALQAIRNASKLDDIQKLLSDTSRRHAAPEGLLAVHAQISESSVLPLPSQIQYFGEAGEGGRIQIEYRNSGDNQGGFELILISTGEHPDTVSEIIIRPYKSGEGKAFVPEVTVPSNALRGREIKSLTVPEIVKAFGTPLVTEQLVRHILRLPPTELVPAGTAEALDRSRGAHSTLVSRVHELNTLTGSQEKRLQARAVEIKGLEAKNGLLEQEIARAADEHMAYRTSTRRRIAALLGLAVGGPLLTMWLTARHMNSTSFETDGAMPSADAQTVAVPKSTLDEMRSAQARVASLEVERAQLLTAQSGMESELQTVRTSASQDRVVADTYKAEVTRLQQRVAELDSLKSKLEGELKAAQDSAASQQTLHSSELEQLRGALQRAEQAANESRTAVQNETAATAGLRQSISMLEGKLAQTRTESDARAAALTAEVQRVTDELQQAKEGAEKAACMLRLITNQGGDMRACTDGAFDVMAQAVPGGIGWRFTTLPEGAKVEFGNDNLKTAIVTDPNGTQHLILVPYPATGLPTDTEQPVTGYKLSK